MKIRNKILLYFSATTIALVAVALFIIYWIFSAYREEDFQQRQKDKIITTLYFISEIQKNEKELTEAIDRLSINSFLNEKLLIFDSKKQLIYSSLDDVPIDYSDKLLRALSEQNVWIEQKDELYDVVAIHFKANNNSYYGISKAYDESGYTKLTFLKHLLTIVFFIFSAIVILISIYIANRISKPISELALLLGQYTIGKSPRQAGKRTNTYELDFLNVKFNELLHRINNAYTFQKNAVHHISHQLKTPITILISEMERIKQKTNDKILQQDIDKNISKTKSLAEIINTLLEISKIEAGQNTVKNTIRIDEIIFDCIEELNTLHPEFIFEVNYLPAEPDTDALSIMANEMLIRQAFQNLLSNCIAYSDSNNAGVKIDSSGNEGLSISFINPGATISAKEEKLLFTHFFRGENSRNKIGFGLGLTLTKAIIELHNGTIKYTNPERNLNVFEVKLLSS